MPAAPSPVGRISPNTGNLLLGKGIVLFKLTTDSVYFHMGNVPSLAITPKTELLDHYSAQQTSSVRDFQAVNRKSMEMKIVMEEATARNLSLLMLGDVDANITQPTVHIFTQGQLEGHMKFFGTQQVGPRWYIDLPSVQINPQAAFDPIGDKFVTLEVQGAVNSADGITWGSMQLQPAIYTIAPECILTPFIDTDVTTGKVGHDMQAYVGAFVGVSLGVTYQWNKDAVPIYGATNSVYTPVSGDVGHTITVTVTGTNGIGSTSATSAGVGLVVA